GFTPILRLIGLIAFAILVIVLLVFWIQGCQNSSKTNAYKNYMTQVAAVARASSQTGKTLNSTLVTPGIKQAELVQKINGQEQQNVQHADTLSPPGHLRQANQQMIEALQLRVSGIRGLANAFQSTTKTTDSAKAGAMLAEQAKRLIASDVVWDDLFQAPATQILNQQGVHGVAVPHSHVVTNSELTSAATFADIVKRLHGSTPGSGGTTSGLHGTGIESTTAQPQNLVLSQTNDNKVIASTNLRFDVAVKNTGDNLETSIPVT